MNSGTSKLLREIVEAVKKLSAEKQNELLVILQSGAVGGFRELVEKNPELHTVDLETIAATYDVSVRSLHRYISAGKLLAVRFGQKYLVTLVELDRFLNAK